MRKQFIVVSAVVTGFLLLWIARGIPSTGSRIAAVSPLPTQPLCVKTRGSFGTHVCCAGYSPIPAASHFTCKRQPAAKPVTQPSIFNLTSSVRNGVGKRPGSASLEWPSAAEGVRYLVYRKVLPTSKIKLDSRAVNQKLTLSRWSLVNVITRTKNGKSWSLAQRKGQTLIAQDGTLRFGDSSLPTLASTYSYVYRLVLLAADGLPLADSGDQKVGGRPATQIPSAPTATPTATASATKTPRVSYRCENYSCIPSDTPGEIPCDPSSPEICWGAPADGKCCIAVYDSRCGRNDDPMQEVRARDFMKDASHCATKLVMSWEEYQRFNMMQLPASCESSLVVLFAHGPRPEQLVSAAQICVEKLKCDGTTYSYACQNFRDVTAANTYLRELQKSVPEGISLTITGNQSNGIVAGACPSDMSNSRVSFKVTWNEVKCELRDCPQQYGICSPVGTQAICIRKSDGKRVVQNCCEASGSYGEWGAPGEQCATKFKCTGDNPRGSIEDFLRVACPDQDTSKLTADKPYSLVEKCGGPCDYTCSSIAKFSNGTCVPKEEDDAANDDDSGDTEDTNTEIPDDGEGQFHSPSYYPQ